VFYRFVSTQNAAMPHEFMREQQVLTLDALFEKKKGGV
jgi:hypothetical protein